MMALSRETKLKLKRAAALKAAVLSFNPLTFAAEPRRYTEADLQAAIDADRIKGFMLFTRNLPAEHDGLVFGTAGQARAIMRALTSAGY